MTRRQARAVVAMFLASFAGTLLLIGLLHQAVDLLRGQ